MTVDSGVRVIIHLDSYPHWFNHQVTNDDDSNSRPDFLLITAKVDEDLKIMLDAKVIECIMAFSSASSVGTLPLNMECAQKLGADKEVTSFVLPLGATINMDGTAIYQGVCAVFIASCFGIELTLSQMLTIVLTATLASIGTAGVPGAGMVMLTMVLQSVGLPVEGIALVAGVDRIFDMGRTVVNITGDSACAIVVSELQRRRTAR
jgi:Na+/H+-dicarboxylate symporter